MDPAICNSENVKYLVNIMDKIICDEIIDVKETSFYEKNITSKTQIFYILLIFLLITMTLLIAVGTYCYLIKYRAKQKHLSSFHDTQLKTTQY